VYILLLSGQEAIESFFSPEGVCRVLLWSLSRRFVLMSGDLGGGVPPPLTLIYRGLPPIKLLLLRAFLENLDFVTANPYKSRFLIIN
jgi:hypothetical protein